MKISLLFSQICIVIVCFLGDPAFAREDPVERPAATRTANVVVMTISGRISKRTLESFKSASPVAKGDPIPAGLIVLLDSSGGDGAVAMEIGRMLRRAKAHIFVTGQCSSACMFILASGVVRGAPPYTVGIHRGRITVTDPDGKILKEVDASENPKAAAALKKFEQDAQAYFAEMGMPPQLFAAMQAHTQKGVYRLNHSEVAKFGLTGFEPQYFDQRAKLFEAQKGPYRMDGSELRRRTARVASRCGEFHADRKKFVDCYSEVLRDRFLN